MKHKTLNVEGKKLQLKKTTIEVFDMQPRHLRMIIGKGHKEMDPGSTIRCDTQSPTSQTTEP